MSHGHPAVVGYGTFITKGHWKDKFNVEICEVNDFVRIFPKGNWFPFALPSKGSSFKALKFNVEETHLIFLDEYEGVPVGLFERIKTPIILTSGSVIDAFMYVPTQKTIETQKLTTILDKNDQWREEIKKFPEIILQFPELIL